MNSNQSRVIQGGASVFLDSLRVWAALVVLFLHAKDQWFPSQIHNSTEPGNLAHAAVVVFFVLSGYVIAHTTTSNSRGPLQYAEARLSRLCSVVVPALLVSALAESLLRLLDPALFREFSRGLSWLRYILSGGFLNEVWFLSAAPPINIPLWSLSFEFWYYLIFCLYFFKSDGWKAYLPILGVCLFAGPKILLMLPVWAVGVVAYRLPRPSISVTLSWGLVVGCLAFTFFIIKYFSPFPFGIGSTPLFYVNQFFTEWIIGAGVAMTLWILPTSIQASQHPKWGEIYTKVTDLTFLVYVLHFPLLVLFKVFFNFQKDNEVQMWQDLAFELAISIVIGFLLEKQRNHWSLLFRWILRNSLSRLHKVLHPSFAL